MGVHPRREKICDFSLAAEVKKLSADRMAQVDKGRVFS
jgi:hypothetical protein